MARRITPRAQCLGHIWISDEVLNQAIHRFERVSRAQKRYGSHVPGPMEAARRSTHRRRYGVALGSSGPPTAPDWTSILDSLWSWSRDGSEQNWKWTAPNLATKKKPPGMQSNIDLRDTTVENLQEHEYRQVMEESRAQFAELLRDLEGVHILKASMISPCLEFLLSAADVPEADNMVYLAHFMVARGPTTKALVDFINVLHRKAALDSATHPYIPATITTLWRSSLCRSRGEAALTELLELLDPPDLEWLLPETWMQMMHTPTTHSSDSIDAVIAWLGVLRGLTTRRPEITNYISWVKIYLSLSGRWTPIELRPFLSLLNPFELCSVLIQHWLPYFGGQQNTYVDRRSHMSFDFKSLSPGHFNSSQRRNLLEQFEASISDSERGDASRCLIAVMGILRQHELPYATFCSTFLDVWSHGKEEQDVVKVALNVVQRTDNFPILVAEQLIKGLLSNDTKDSVYHAHQVFREYPSISSSCSEELARALVKHGFTSGAWPRRILSILTRRTSLDLRARQASRNLRGSTYLSLSDSQIRTIDEVATGFATAKNVTNRKALRQVWMCYRFLRSYRAPISSTILQAMVEAGVLRFVAAGQDVPLPMATYILDLVRRHEGDEAARRLEAQFAKIPRGWRKRRFVNRGRIAFSLRPWGAPKNFATQRQLSGSREKRYIQS